MIDLGVGLGIVLLSLFVGFWWWWLPRVKEAFSSWNEITLTPEMKNELRISEQLRQTLKHEIESNKRLAKLSIERRDKINKLQQQLSPGLYADGGLTSDESHALYDHNQTGYTQ